MVMGNGTNLLIKDPAIRVIIKLGNLGAIEVEATRSRLVPGYYFLR